MARSGAVLAPGGCKEGGDQFLRRSLMNDSDVFEQAHCLNVVQREVGRLAPVKSLFILHVHNLQCSDLSLQVCITALVDSPGRP